MAGTLLGAGRTAEVYAIDAQRVRKRFTMTTAIHLEAAAMRHVNRHGFPAPELYDVEDDGLVMQRVNGPTLAAALVDGVLPFDDGARVLADLHRRLHTLPPMSGLPGGTTVHLDLHPENIILADDGPIVIDWANADDGTPELDIALTGVILGETALRPEYAGHNIRGLMEGFVGYAGGDPTRAVDRAVAIRLTNPTLSPQELAAVVRAGELVRDAIRHTHS